MTTVPLPYPLVFIWLWYIELNINLSWLHYQKYKREDIHLEWHATKKKIFWNPERVETGSYLDLDKKKVKRISSLSATLSNFRLCQFASCHKVQLYNWYCPTTNHIEGSGLCIQFSLPNAVILCDPTKQVHRMSSPASLKSYWCYLGIWCVFCEPSPNRCKTRTRWI